MNILAPVNTYESAETFIEMGADEIYVGLDDELFKTFSFTGRGKMSYGGLKVLPDFNTLKEIVRYAHNKNVLVNFIANLQFFHNGNIGGEDIEKTFLQYVEKGLSAEIDSIVIGDIGLLERVYKQNYHTDIHASIYLRSINSQELLFLKSLGVKRTTLSYHITMNEIEMLAALDIMDLEVIGYLGCSFFNGACGFLHELGEGLNEYFDPGVACKNVYSVSGNGFEKNVSFDVEAGCSLCTLHSLEQCGVSALKIVGRDRRLSEIKEVVRLYKNVLNQQRSGEFLYNENAIIPTWWRKVWCEKNKCKYSMNPYVDYMIGG